MGDAPPTPVESVVVVGWCCAEVESKPRSVKNANEKSKSMALENLRLYVGTKTLKVVPFKRSAYNLPRRWTMPEKRDLKKEGYLVEYQDSGKPNFLNFVGYTS